MTDTDFDLDDEPVLTAEGEVAAAICGHQGTADAPVKRLAPEQGARFQPPRNKENRPGFLLDSKSKCPTGWRALGAPHQRFLQGSQMTCKV